MQLQGWSLWAVHDQILFIDLTIILRIKLANGLNLAMQAI